MRSRLRVGCIGAGFIAGRHLTALASFADVDVVAVADSDPVRGRLAADTVGGRSYGDGQSLLAAEELDAVWICVPPFVHGDLEEAVLERGIPMFVEKPLSADLAVAEAIARRVEDTGLLTAVGYHWRYLSAVESARTFLRDRPPRLVSGWWLDTTPGAPWWVQRARSGGQLVEQTTHILDLVRLLVGEVQSVQGLEAPAVVAPVDHSGTDVAAQEAVPSAAVLTLRFASGAIGTVTSARCLPKRHRVALEVLGDDFAVEVSERSLTDHDLRVTTRDGTRVETSLEDPVRAEDRAFLDAVLGRGDDVRCTYAEALLTHRLACAADRSAREGGRAAGPVTGPVNDLVSDQGRHHG